MVSISLLYRMILSKKEATFRDHVLALDPLRNFDSKTVPWP